VATGNLGGNLAFTLLSTWRFCGLLASWWAPSIYFGEYQHLGKDPAFLLEGTWHLGGHLASWWAPSVYFPGYTAFWWTAGILVGVQCLFLCTHAILVVTWHHGGHLAYLWEGIWHLSG